MQSVTSRLLWGFIFYNLARIVFQNSAWSCSWDLNNTHYIYAGLQVTTFFFLLYLLDVGTSIANLHAIFVQNGSVLVFDMRQTAGPVKSLVGLTSNPVHTVQSLAQTSSLPSGARTILSASAIGLCQWNVDSEER